MIELRIYEMFYEKECSSQISQESAVLESLFNKVAGLQACHFIKKRLQNMCFPVIIAKFLRASILKNIC